MGKTKLIWLEGISQQNINIDIQLHMGKRSKHIYTLTFRKS